MANGSGNDDARARQMAALARYSGPKQIYSTTVTLTQAGGLVQVDVPGYINLELPAECIEVVLRFRDVIAAANMTVAAAESPMTIFQNARLYGNHRRWGAKDPYNISGATAFIFHQLFQYVGATAIFGGSVAAGVYLPPRSMPYGQALATFGNTGTYDVELHLPLVAGLLVGGVDQASEILNKLPYLWRREDWGDSLKLRILLGDSTSFGTNAGGTTHTFTGFGSAAGLPSIDFNVNYAMLGDYRNVGARGLILRAEQSVTTLVTAANAQRVLLLDKNITSNVLVKSGTILAGSTPGVSVFAALSDAQLTTTRVLMALDPVRDIANNYAGKAYYMRKMNAYHPQGYYLISFTEGGNMLNAFRADLPKYAGATFELNSNVATAGATQAVNVVQEQILSEGLFPANG